jgi:hypothetical protein
MTMQKKPKKSIIDFSLEFAAKHTILDAPILNKVRSIELRNITFQSQTFWQNPKSKNGHLQQSL